MVNGVAGWLGWCSTHDKALAASSAAVAHGAEGVVLHRGESTSVIRVTGGDDGLRDSLATHCDVGLHRTATRHVLRHVRTWPLDTASPGVTMLFSINRRPGMDVDDFHDWWERSHAPIALRHHVGMWDYAQVSVVDTVHGDPWDGFAVTQWPTLDDLMHRFSSGPEGTEALRHDAAQFTDATTLQRALMDEIVVLEPEWPTDGDVPIGVARSVEVPLGTDVAGEGLLDGVSVEVRLDSRGLPRLDVLWRSVIPAAEVTLVPSRFDRLWSTLTAPIGVAVSVVE
jgi:hypothetical protein